MKTLLAIGIGAGVGSYGRYLVSLPDFSLVYPAGTFLANVSGSLLLGIFSGYFSVKKPKEWMKAGLGVGLCGGYTTFSTFAFEVNMFLFHEQWLEAAIYMAGTLAGGITLVFLGFYLGERMGGGEE
ncbi:fluoride efflux transporter FluC [Bacillus piscicola]|uniref:fluoride efflux transporter FluC n=1 Tax=Bacillus piscicola TaxID=1632684 RepID=UPI001F0987E9|nr:CrcB family protein [Bacillus piscicola]